MYVFIYLFIYWYVNVYCLYVHFNYAQLILSRGCVVFNTLLFNP
jgi:hypothetical protein